MKSVRIWSGPI